MSCKFQMLTLYIFRLPYWRTIRRSSNLAPPYYNQRQKSLARLDQIAWKCVDKLFWKQKWWHHWNREPPSPLQTLLYKTNTLNLEDCLLYLSSIISQFLDFIFWMVFDFIFYSVTLHTHDIPMLLMQPNHTFDQLNSIGPTCIWVQSRNWVRLSAVIVHNQTLTKKIQSNQLQSNVRMSLIGHDQVWVVLLSSIADVHVVVIWLQLRTIIRCFFFFFFFAIQILISQSDLNNNCPK